MTDTPKRRDCDRVDEATLNVFRAFMREVEKNGNGRSWKSNLDPKISLGSAINLAAIIGGWLVFGLVWVGGVEKTIAIAQNEIVHLWAAVGELKVWARDK